MKSIDIHQANVIGLGAEKFASGIFNQIKNSEKINVENIYINKYSPDKKTSDFSSKVMTVNYSLGHLSRVVEILFWRLIRSQKNEILVLGDLPLNTSAKQYVLCHQSLIFKSFSFPTKDFLKFFLFRTIYKLFLKKEDVIIVQSKDMASKVLKTFGENVNVEVLDIKSDYFEWPDFRRTKKHNVSRGSTHFKSIYPSAFYPHKNHQLLNQIKIDEKIEIILTLDECDFNSKNRSVSFIGEVSRERIYDIYKEIDAMIFLSSEESLGLPILEAMKSNLPIICPNADYTKDLNSDNCFFFNIDDPETLEEAIKLASVKISEGWWPDWNFENELNQSFRVSIEKILTNEK